MGNRRTSPLIRFPAPAQHAGDAPHRSMWGFADSGFVVRDGTVVLQSRRYQNGGQPLVHFAPFVEKAVGVAFDPADRHEPVEPRFPPALPCEPLVQALKALLGQQRCSQDDELRLRHGHGHHLEEIYEVLFGELKRVPDLVVFPENEAEIESLLRISEEHHALVVPFGGGTCVTKALCCEDEERPVVSLDLSRMNRILWLDPESKTACIQAGAVGRVLEAQLNAEGYTLGHEPDSIEFSTLGGWIATNASGMKKNKYGNIEDIVQDVTVVTRDGAVHHPCVVPRSSHGLDVRRLVFGSEGLLGVISQAVVAVHSLPEVKKYGSLVFPTWQAGLSFMRALASHQATPASVRLVDNMQFQFGRALKPDSGSSLGAALQKFFVSKIKGIDLEQMVACTIVYEGRASEQAALSAQVAELSKSFGGFSAGGAAGKDGYNLTFGIAYIRDFLLQYWTLGDSFETSVPWGKVNDVMEQTKAAVIRAHREESLQGHPFVTARVSQIYPTGCCVYFYIGFHYKTCVQPLKAFKRIEHEARVAILDAGGALSHHHGVGKLWAPYLERIKSEAALTWVDKISRAIDPAGTFASGNQRVSSQRERDNR